MPKATHYKKRETKLFSMKELSQESGIKKSSIHHYLNLGLLPKSVQVGLSLHLYDEIHLARLKEIRRLRKEANLSLPRIKEILDSQDWRVETVRSKALPPDDFPQTGRIDPQLDDVEVESKRELILKTAAELFSRRGYDRVRINDISDALLMGKSTFYVYFRSKEELFLECIDKLSVYIVPRKAWSDIKKEPDFFRKFAKRVRAFLKSFSGYRGILHQARMLSDGEDPRLAQKAKEALMLVASPLQRDLERAQQNGVIREIDPELVSHFLLASAESLGQRLAMDSKYRLEEGVRILVDFIKFGLVSNSELQR